MFLTDSELYDFTGYQLPGKQAKWLAEKGYLFEIGADRKPKVLRAHIMARLGGTVQSEPTGPKLRLK